MQPVSQKWLPALASDHGVSVRVNVLYNGSIVAEDIPFTDGTVRVDRGSDTRRSLSLTIADPSDFPVNPTDKFAVYGQQIYVEGGLTYLDGTMERVPLGTFVIASVEGNIHTGPLNIQASGLETLMKREVWDTAVSTAGYSSAAGFLRYHIPDTLPGAAFVDRSTHGVEPLASKTWDAQSDRWATFAEIAASCGAELFCDANGTFVLADIPNPDDVTAEPVWEVAAGERGVMVSAVMSLSADGVYNRVVAMGENAEDNKPPVRAVAAITNSADPLRYGGPFGKVTKTHSSSLITSTTQATATATALLAKYKAPNRTVTLEAVPNPALDAGDRIRVVYGSAALPEIHVVNSFDIPLGVDGGSFQIQTVSGKADD